VEEQFDTFVSGMCFGGTWHWFRLMFVSHILFIAPATLAVVTQLSDAGNTAFGKHVDC
jgi:hypothetical protein